MIMKNENEITVKDLTALLEKKKIRTVEGIKFIKLFLQHVLPERFMKIRNYGFLSSRNKTKMLENLHDYYDKTNLSPIFTLAKSQSSNL